MRMTIYAENLKQVMLELVRSIQIDYARLTGAARNDGTNDGSILNRLDHALAALNEAASRAQPACTPVPTSSQQGKVDENWLKLVLQELGEFNCNGVDYINSCSEALVKSHGIINCVYENPQTRKRIFYRGETNYGWLLRPRVGRGSCKYDPEAPLRATECELNYLAEFQEMVQNDANNMYEAISGQQTIPHDNDPTWWALMQHYDVEHGTRMIDITSSLFCGLFFACSNLDGTIDESTDGALYLIHSEHWRTESQNPYTRNGRIYGPEDRMTNSVQEYFNIQNNIDTLRFREARDLNDRLTSQDGFFLWQPKFDETLDIPNCFKFRVYREAKKHILRELYSIGYTARRIVRSLQGEETHLRLCEELELPAH